MTGVKESGVYLRCSEVVKCKCRGLDSRGYFGVILEIGCVAVQGGSCGRGKGFVSRFTKPLLKLPCSLVDNRNFLRNVN